MVCPGFNWLRIESNYRLCEHGKETSDFVQGSKVLELLI
jgi:hypothetical protein